MSYVEANGDQAALVTGSQRYYGTTERGSGGVEGAADPDVFDKLYFFSQNLLNYIIII
jgi:hypothetical protein